MDIKKIIIFFLFFLLLSSFVLGVYYVYNYMPVGVKATRFGPRSIGVDWKEVFRPAIIQLFRLESPYDIEMFFNPPWVLIPFIPVALLSPEMGSAVMFVLNLFCWVYVAFRFRMNPILLVIFFLCSPVYWTAGNGNIEGIAALGFVLPPPLGMFFMLAKPQFGIAVAVFWIIESMRGHNIFTGIQNATRLLLPVSLGIFISILIFLPSLSFRPSLSGVWWNASLFPWGIPAGVILLGLSIWRRDIRFSIAASPFFSPYLTGHTWSVVWFGLLLLAGEKITFPKEVKDATKA